MRNEMMFVRGVDLFRCDAEVGECRVLTSDQLWGWKRVSTVQGVQNVAGGQ